VGIHGKRKYSGGGGNPHLVVGVVVVVVIAVVVVVIAVVGGWHRVSVLLHPFVYGLYFQVCVHTCVSVYARGCGWECTFTVCICVFVVHVRACCAIESNKQSNIHAYKHTYHFKGIIRTQRFVEPAFTKE